MKSTLAFHREALDQALRVALSTSQPALKREALQQASRHLVHPQLLLDSPLLTDAHPWRREALVIADAFEAVTNGMEHPGVLEALDDLPPDSVFQDWRHLILALHFFYEELDEAVVAHLDRIHEHSPVALLATTVRHLLGRPLALTPAQRRLASLVVQPDPVLQQGIQDIAEGLENDEEALFWGALTDWLEIVTPHHGAHAQAAVLWAWNQLEWRDFDEAVLLDLSKSLWGTAESYRLAALGTLPWDPEGASLLWFRFLLTALREGADDATLDEGWRWLQRFREAALDDPASGLEYEDLWANLTWSWNAEMRARGAAEVAVTTPNTRTAPPDGQLDLFA